MAKVSKKPGATWFAQAGSKDSRFTIGSEHLGDMVFDELAVSYPSIHLEQMDGRKWWVELGGYHFWIKAEKDGTTTITHDGRELGTYGLTKE